MDLDLPTKRLVVLALAGRKHLAGYEAFTSVVEPLGQPNGGSSKCCESILPMNCCAVRAMSLTAGHRQGQHFSVRSFTSSTLAVALIAPNQCQAKVPNSNGNGYSTHKNY